MIADIASHYRAVTSLTLAVWFLLHGLVNALAIRGKRRKLGIPRGTRVHKTELDFHKLRQSPPDEFFEECFLELMRQSRELTVKYFGQRDLDNFNLDKHLDSLSPRLLPYIEAVARPDPSMAEWDAIFASQYERPYLYQAVIWKVLQERVFDELFFGASLEHRKLLEAQDVQLEELDGFQRTELRCKTNVAYQTNLQWMDEEKNKTTPFFWDQVDQITAQLAILLSDPLHHDRPEGPPSADDSRRGNFYCSLHELVAKSAYLSHAMRLHTGIFAFSWPKPGDRWGYHEVNYNHMIILASERAAEAFDRRVGERPNRMDRVKIAVTPDVRLYKRGITSRVATATKILEARAIYYRGYQDELRDADMRKTLQEARFGSPRWAFIDHLQMLLVAGAISVLLVVSKPSMIQATQGLIGKRLEGIWGEGLL